MKVSEKQLLIMLRTLEGSLRSEDTVSTNFGYDRETRIKIYNQIMNQQSEKLIEVKE